MDSRFSEISRTVLKNSHDIASEMGYNYVGSEHILLAICESDITESGKILRNIDYRYKIRLCNGCPPSEIQQSGRTCHSKSGQIFPP